MTKPKIVTICGSSRFCDIIAVCGWLIERDEQAVVLSLHLLPGWYCTVDNHMAEHQGVADQMDKLHLQKIDMADEIFVVEPGDYIGDSTKNEISYAASLDMPIRYYTSDPIGMAVREAGERSKMLGWTPLS